MKVLVLSLTVALLSVLIISYNFWKLDIQALPLFIKKLFVDSKIEDDNIFIRKENGKLITEESLASFRGYDNDKIYLAILGQVFDVTSGKRHYGTSGSYSYFAGKDGTRSFVDGLFTSDVPGYEISDFTGSQLLEVYKWIQFYNSKYTFIGKVVGRFYDENGGPLNELTSAFEKYKLAVAEKFQLDELNKIFPSCNVAWKENEGTKLWCTSKSGSIEREWTGIPRSFFDQNLQSTRCVCVKNTGKPSFDFIQDQNNGDLNHPNLKIFDKCDPNANECFIF
ncbi:hypothetical protein HELRODRAFT_65888 [Helobdella robusta]|uniref:Cytochrome b5 heme-binding domain-containing protein n=1 Tax=Helobdella robusta TaxID=6412 RepID=T1FYE2_HELRO|nr:hypothetical protein HELRODRAFT_65888 [Helobdella robusta]ESO02026.1 hypothetical protein HELRODRAFT_65888 [Helobdella robusta]